MLEQYCSAEACACAHDASSLQALEIVELLQAYLLASPSVLWQGALPIEV
jgi:hypothetical protein